VAWVKAAESTDGKPICLAIRERSAGGQFVDGARAQVVADAGKYKPVRVNHVATKGGSRIDAYVLRQGSGVQPGEAFLVDAISLSDSDAENASPDCSI
jgi:hypothetical protein